MSISASHSESDGPKFKSASKDAMTFPLSGSSRDIFRYLESAETGTNRRFDFASISTSPGLPPSLSAAAEAEKHAQNSAQKSKCAVFLIMWRK